MMKRNSREKIPINLLEIVFVVGVLSKFISNSSKKHSEVVNIILRYLSGTKDKCLCLGKGDVSIIGYTYSNYVGCFDSRKSTSKYSFQSMGGAISWRRCLQECIALSTIEAKYIAIIEACTEVVLPLVASL